MDKKRTRKLSSESGGRRSGARTESLAVRFTMPEVELLMAAAQSEGLPLRQWMRERLLGGAQERTGNVVLTELVAQHMLLQSSLLSIHNALGLSGAQFEAKLQTICREKHIQAARLLEKHRNGSYGENA